MNAQDAHHSLISRAFAVIISDIVLRVTIMKRHHTASRDGQREAAAKLMLAHSSLPANSNRPLCGHPQRCKLSLGQQIERANGQIR